MLALGTFQWIALVLVIALVVFMWVYKKKQG